MKTKSKTLLFVSAFSALTLSANAAVINILNMTAEDTSRSGFTISVTGTTTKTFSFSQTGDLDGGLGGDDTLTFDLIYEAYTGSTFDGTDVTLGATQITPNTNNVNFHSNAFEGGNTLFLQVANISYTSGESTVTFNGFTAIQPTSYASTGDGDFDYYVGLTGASTVTGDPTFTPSLTSNGTDPTLYFTSATGQDPVRLRNLDFQFETSAVPEPSSVALLGLGVAGFMLRRRRN